MKRIMDRFFRTLAAAAFLIGGLMPVSCGKMDQPYKDKGKNVFLYYAAGHNSLSGYITSDIEELTENHLPKKKKWNNTVLMYCRLKDYKNYPDAAPSYLIRLYRKHDGTAALDTLMTMEPEVNACDPNTLHEVLSYIRRKYPDRKYGMLFSSHATGWLPKGYYGNEKKYEGTEDEFWRSGMKKTIGQDAVGKESFEMELKDFAEAIPMHMEYIVFDSCLMGGVEVAWELRKVCSQVGFSQTEILADGFDYKKMIGSLFKEPMEQGAERICRDYFHQYELKPEKERYATISLVETAKMEHLAQVCRTLTGKYRGEIDNLGRSIIQRYYRYDYDYFFDLEDIFAKTSTTSEEMEELRKALDECVIYKAATKDFLPDFGGFEINCYSGLSMYLPSRKKPKLNEHYKTLDWNIATSLVK